MQSSIATDQLLSAIRPIDRGVVADSCDADTDAHARALTTPHPHPTRQQQGQAGSGRKNVEAKQEDGRCAALPNTHPDESVRTRSSLQLYKK